MFNVNGSLSRVSEVVQSSSLSDLVSFSIVEVTFCRICSTIYFGISDNIFLIVAVSIAMVPIFVEDDGIVSII